MANKFAYVSGLEETMAGISGALNLVKHRTAEGMLHAMRILHEDMKNTYPAIPKRSGDLRASWYVEIFYINNDPNVIAGFNIDYAKYVHEMPTTYHWRYPNSGPKFAEAHVNRLGRHMVEIVALHAKTALLGMGIYRKVTPGVNQTFTTGMVVEF
jgi:hypothetical protein